jgi:hypothetical protein
MSAWIRAGVDEGYEYGLAKQGYVGLQSPLAHLLVSKYYQSQ